MSLEDSVRIQHMLDAARQAVSFAQGQTKATAPHIPWRIMAATRNRLIHAYFSVDLRIVLNTAQTDLPQIRSAS